MSGFQPIIYVLMEIVRHHKLYNEFYVCPHASNKIKEGEKDVIAKSPKVYCYLLFFCNQVAKVGIYIPLKLEKHWNMWSQDVV